LHVLRLEEHPIYHNLSSVYGFQRPLCSFRRREANLRGLLFRVLPIAHVNQIHLAKLLHVAFQRKAVNARHHALRYLDAGAHACVVGGPANFASVA